MTSCSWANCGGRGKLSPSLEVEGDGIVESLESDRLVLISGSQPTSYWNLPSLSLHFPIVNRRINKTYLFGVNV